jgi:hypothetical protein
LTCVEGTSLETCSTQRNQYLNLRSTFPSLLLDYVQHPLAMHRRSTSSTLNFQPQTRCVPPLRAQIPMQDAPRQTTTSRQPRRLRSCDSSARSRIRAHQRRGHACHACIHSSAPNLPDVSTALASASPPAYPPLPRTSLWLSHASPSSSSRPSLSSSHSLPSWLHYDLLGAHPIS